MKKIFFILMLLMTILVFAACNEETPDHTHAYGDWTVTKSPTCTVAGEEIRTCACGENEVRSIGTQHNFSAWSASTPASCIAKGVESRTCACGATETRTIEMVDHTFANGSCAICHATDGLAYKLNEGGLSYAVNGIGTATATSIVIPEHREGKPVTSITERAFQERTSLVSVKIPGSVLTVGEMAFSRCSSLETVEMAEGVQSIGEEAFYNCISLRNVRIPSTVTSMIIPFNECPSLNYTTYKNGKYLGNETDPCLYLADVVDTTATTFEVANTTKFIFCAFYDCTAMTAITLPASLLSIFGDTFCDCTALKDVFISDLAAWCAIDFSDSPDTPFYYASNLYLNNTLVTDLTIPSTVKELKRYAFYGCDSITSASIPSSVAKINSRAFAKCTSLASITIPASVTYIGGNAFSDCTVLTSAIFAQTNGWTVDMTESISNTALTIPATAAEYLKTTYRYKVWNRIP